MMAKPADAITHRLLQPALLALEDSPNGECPAGGLASDPLIDEAQQERRRHMAVIVCRGASTAAAWLIADRLAQSWGFSCAALGTPKPADPDGERRQAAKLLRNAKFLSAEPEKT